jgi:cellulose synthase/poly-beta-1,6-N-acetylglucosamine synthase-like glycosyltransferase
MNTPPFSNLDALWITLLAVTQILYAISFLVDLYFFSRPVNRVDPSEIVAQRDLEQPFIVLLYPVLRELEGTMRTTLGALGRMDYPADRFSVVAIPNSDDAWTIGALHRLQQEFSFLEILEVPPTTDPQWLKVWRAWDENPNVYWWHRGPFAGDRNLPPKKTRQMVFAIYEMLKRREGGEDFLVNYIDADSAPPRDHFLAGAAGMRSYDVLQSENIAGNLNASLAASLHAFDHMAWDGMKYRHLSADGRHPYWMLGKGLFFRASDLEQLGSLNPWIAIEDPEVGMRFWAAGKRLGIISAPLIEEVPETFGRGVTQRRRWVCGFFQSLGQPLDELGFSPVEKIKAWLNFLPCLSLWINAVGFPIGVWALAAWIGGADILPTWLTVLCAINLIAFAFSMTCLYVSTWRRTALVLEHRRDRIAYMLRINPLFIMLWWVAWLIPLALGLRMVLRDGGRVWERTEKINANEELLRSQAREA